MPKGMDMWVVCMLLLEIVCRAARRQNEECSIAHVTSCGRWDNYVIYWNATECHPFSEMTSLGLSGMFDHDLVLVSFLNKRLIPDLEPHPLTVLHFHQYTPYNDLQL
jgi:hypothetical protein